MSPEFYRRERRLERLRNLRALLALAIWGGGCWLLHLAWDLRLHLPEPYHDAIGTAVYLVTFFYIFAFWPILAGIERLGGRRRAQDGGRATSAATSSIATSRAADGGASSPAAGS
jgi:hypothetical protein